MRSSSSTKELVPFYKTIKLSFNDVPTDEPIRTEDFCDATEAIIDFFNLLPNAAFTIGQADINMKLVKLRSRLQTHPSTSSTLLSILHDERLQHGKGPNGSYTISQSQSGSATSSIRWLVRDLAMIYTGLSMNLASETEEISESFTKAYGMSLGRYHSRFTRGGFYIAMKVVPYRAKLYARLGDDQDKVMSELEVWLSGLERILRIVEEYFLDGEWGPTVFEQRYFKDE